MRIKERIHIIPIGDDDLERIIFPAIKGKADRVYLITMKDHDLFSTIVNQVHSKMKEEFIESIVVHTDMQDFKQLVLTFARLIQKESIEHNYVYLSISTGGNLAASAGTFVSTLFNAIPYFCTKDFQTNTIKTNLIRVPTFNITPPSKNLIKFLNSVDEIANDGGVSKKRCLKIMKSIHPKEDFSGTSGDYNKLKFRYLDKLQEKNFILIEDKLRGTITLTQEGLLALELYRIFYSL